MFSLGQRILIYKMLMLIFAFGGLISLSFNIILTHQYAHAVNILIEHMRVIHKAEVTSEELKSYIGKEENRELNLTKELKTIIENRENNEKGKE